ncbi:MAG TPA: hypothetical protein VHP36_03035 [Chitinispirillaceae bacterium]|nr:hypothetical protein [Chitinispirillaceae bacterium]
MANSKNIIIGLLIVIIIFLAFLSFRPMMYSSTYNQDGYQPGHMGPGMMNNPGYNDGSGSGIMGSMMTSNMMMGNMMAIYYPESEPVTQDKALRSMRNFSRQCGSNIEVEDFMVFSGNYYGVLKDPNSSQYIAEVLVDRYSGLAYAEPGPNMMWNTRFGAGRTGTEGTEYDLSEAENLTTNFLGGYLPEAQIMESKEMPGYYTFDFGRQEIEGMLSVNAYNGQIWVHTWHGPFLGGMNVTS